MTAILLGLLIALLVWVVLEPTWLPKAPETRLADWIHTASKVTRRQARNWWGFLSGSDRAHTRLSEEFRKWALAHLPVHYAAAMGEDTDGAAKFRRWLDGLSTPALKEYTRALLVFCEALGFDLPAVWEVRTSPEQLQTLQDIILFHALAYAKGRAVRSFAAYARWHAQPDSPRKRATSRLLFQAFTKKNLVVPSAEQTLAKAEERWAYVKNSIHQVALAHPSEFIETFEQVVNPPKHARR